MVDKKENRKPVTLYIDERHQKWWSEGIANNARSDLFNTLLDMYRHNPNFSETVTKSSAHISSTKIHGTKSERRYVRLTPAGAKIIDQAAKKMNLSVSDYIRETCLRYSNLLLNKEHAKNE